MATKFSLLWKSNKKQWLWYIIPSIIVISLIIITIELQNVEEEEIEKSFKKNQINVQETTAKAISKNISFELELLITEMKNLSENDEIQEDLGTDRANRIIQQTFEKMNAIAPTAQILAVDENYFVLSQVSHRQESFVGKKLEGLSLFLNDQNDKRTQPVMTTVRNDPFLKPEIAIIVPIIEKETEILKGNILVTIQPNQFFAKHGNIYDVDTQFLVVLNKNFIILTHPNNDLVGNNFFEQDVQSLDNVKTLREHYKKIGLGTSETITFDDVNGDDLIYSSIPIYINGKIELLFSIVTPLEAINSEITNIILANKIQTTVVLLVALGFLGIFLTKLSQSHKKEKLTIIGQLASNVAHDMRNPLGTIRSSVQRIQKQNKPQNPVIDDELSRIRRSIKRMSHQVEGVLNYVRTIPITTTKSSVKEMLDYALELVTIPNNIEINLPENDAEIECDPEKLEMAFSNLILNAIQSIDDEQGTITINIIEQTNIVKISFENSGPPIPEKDLSEIFKPLFTTKMQGTGLGLSGCKNIIEQHGGTIDVTSNPVRFTIQIPKNITQK